MLYVHHYESFREQVQQCRYFTELKDLVKQAVTEQNFIHLNIIREGLKRKCGRYANRVMDAWIGEYTHE
jgi:hypothetical protein